MGLHEAESSEHECDNDCFKDCTCGRGSYRGCKHRSCYECFLDRRADYTPCVLCGTWHNPEFDTCFKCRPLTRGRDDAAKALRQLVLWRDQYACRYCAAREGDLQVDHRLVRAKCRPNCAWKHTHLIKDDDGMRATKLHVDHIVPCAAGGLADEWNLQTLCHVCNIAKGATWYPGCRHDHEKTKLCRRYRFIADAYFRPEDRRRFLADWAAYRFTGTWDPDIQDSWFQSTSEQGAA